MNILNTELAQKIQDSIIEPLLQSDQVKAMHHIPTLLDELYANIPQKKRISFGRVHTIKVLAQYIYDRLGEQDALVTEIAVAIFEESCEHRTIGVALHLLSLDAHTGSKQVLPCFETAATSDNWEIREFAQMFFRKIIQKHPREMQRYLSQLAKSENPRVRRFVAETLRPCIENKWFYQEPDYPLSVLRRLFRERSPYPRTAVGNNLSDLARRLPELVYALVKELVESGDKNSYWIAYRACRNLVKKDPLRVMDLLHVDEYKYKKRIHKRNDY
jgi:3-methyladenine DNA glycosylase AlkC